MSKSCSYLTLLFSSHSAVESEQEEHFLQSSTIWNMPVLMKGKSEKKYTFNCKEETTSAHKGNWNFYITIL